jgi:HEAT repeats
MSLPTPQVARCLCVFAACALGPLFPSAATADDDGTITLIARLQTQLQSKELNVRRYATLRLLLLGPAAAPAVPDLIDVLRTEVDAQTLRQAAEALAKIGSPSVKGLLELTNDDRAATIAWAVYSLGRTKTQAPQLEKIIERVSECVAHADADVRFNAARSLGSIGREATVDVVIKRLDVEADWSVRLALIAAIGKLGRGSRDAVDKLAALASYTGNENNRIEEANAAGTSLAMVGAPAIGAFDLLLNHPDRAVVGRALDALVKMISVHGHRSIKAVCNTLVKMVGDEAHGPRATTVLLNAPGSAIGGFEGMLELLRGPNGHVQLRAAQLVLSIQPANQRAKDVAIRHLRSGEVECRINALVLVSEMEEMPPETVRAQVEAMARGDEDMGIRMRAQEIIRKWGKR